MDIAQTIDRIHQLDASVKRLRDEAIKLRAEADHLAGLVAVRILELPTVNLVDHDGTEGVEVGFDNTRLTLIRANGNWSLAIGQVIAIDPTVQVEGTQDVD